MLEPASSSFCEVESIEIQLLTSIVRRLHQASQYLVPTLARLDGLNAGVRLLVPWYVTCDEQIIWLLSSLK
jgi:hypothetical protein